MGSSAQVAINGNARGYHLRQTQTTLPIQMFYFSESGCPLSFTVFSEKQFFFFSNCYYNKIFVVAKYSHRCYLSPCPAEPGYTLPLQTMQIQISWLLKKPTDLDLHCLLLSMRIQSNNPDQAIWLAENQKQTWYLNLFSRTRVKFKSKSTGPSCSKRRQPHELLKGHFVNCFSGFNIQYSDIFC